MGQIQGADVGDSCEAGEGANRSKRECLTKLAQKGEALRPELVRASCEAAVSAWQKEPWQAHDSWWAVEEWLELLALSSEPEELLGILSNLPKNFIGPRRLERVLNGLKNSPAPGADEVLLQLAELVPGLDHNPAWLEAALAQSSEAMLEACVAILWDPSRAAKVDLHHPAGKAFVAKLACMFSTDATARAGLLAKLGTTLAAPVQRLLARVVLEMADDDDLLLAYMSILSNDSNHRTTCTS